MDVGDHRFQQKSHVRGGGRGSFSTSIKATQEAKQIETVERHNEFGSHADDAVHEGVLGWIVFRVCADPCIQLYIVQKQHWIASLSVITQMGLALTESLPFGKLTWNLKITIFWGRMIINAGFSTSWWVCRSVFFIFMLATSWAIWFTTNHNYNIG